MTERLVQQENGRGSPGTLRWQVWLPWFALVAILLTATRTDPDLWGHVRFGLDWLRTRQLPSIDPYSFTQDRPWVNHEWLSEAIMAMSFRTAGPAGLVLMKVAIMATAVSVLVGRLRGASPLLRVSVATAAIVATLPLSATIRPQLWSVLGLTLLVPLLDRARPEMRHLLLSAVLFSLWANLHGGWITGAGVLAVHIAFRAPRSPADAASWMSLGIVSLVGTLLNPYGIGLWRFLAATVRTSRPDISEWQPFSLREPALMWVSIIVPLLLLALLARRRENRPPPETIATVCLLTIVGLRVSRVAPLVCMATLGMLGPSIATAWGGFGALKAPSRGAAAILLVPSVVAILAAWQPVSQSLSCLPINDDWEPDRVAAASLVGASGRLWTTFDWGEYAVWHLGPTLRVSIDGRRETVYSEEVIDLHRAVEAGHASALQRLGELSPEYVWMRQSQTRARAVLVEKGYRIEVATPISYVAVRADLPPLPVNRPPLSACFP